MFDTLSKNTLVPLILRLMLAAIFLFHGLDKISGENHEWGMHWMEPPPPGFVQLLVAWGELIGGIAMTLGFLTRIAAVGLIAIMVGAIVQVHWGNFSLKAQGSEYVLTIIAVCLCLILTGGGTLSVDRCFLRRKKVP